MKLRIIKASTPGTYRVEEEDRSATGWHAVGRVFVSVSEANSYMVKHARDIRAREAWYVGEVVDEMEVKPQ